MPKAEKARSGPITSRELSTAIRHLCWLAAHGPSDSIRTGLLKTITASYLDQQERENLPQEPLLHDIFDKARQLPTTVEQVAYFDRLAESGTITEGEFVFLVHEKTTVGQWMNRISDDHREKVNQEIATLFRSYSPKLGTIYSEDHGEKYHRLCDEGRQRWRAEKKQLAAGLLHDSVGSRDSSWGQTMTK